MATRKQIQEDSLSKIKELIGNHNNNEVDFSLNDNDGKINLNITIDKSRLDSSTKEMIASYVGGAL